MIIIKIGGGKNINTKAIINDLKEIKEQVIIVHGANYYRDNLLKDLGFSKKTLTSVSGYTSVYSDETAIDVIMMAYAGLRNKKIVEMCQINGINAIGLSGLDGGLIKARRNQGIRAREQGRVKIIRDYSGKPQEVNKELLQMLLDKNYTPVLCIPLIDENGYAINSENDDVVALLKNTFNTETVVSFIEAEGFLENKDDPDSLVKTMTKLELEKREAQVDGRMKRKMLALKKLFEKGSCKVIIADGRTEHPLKDALAGKGTVIE